MDTGFLRRVNTLFDGLGLHRSPAQAFLVKETTIFIQPKVWEDITVFFELQVNRLGKDDTRCRRHLC